MKIHIPMLKNCVLKHINLPYLLTDLTLVIVLTTFVKLGARLNIERQNI